MGDGQDGAAEEAGGLVGGRGVAAVGGARLDEAFLFRYDRWLFVWVGVCCGLWVVGGVFEEGRAGFSWLCLCFCLSFSSRLPLSSSSLTPTRSQTRPDQTKSKHSARSLWKEKKNSVPFRLPLNPPTLPIPGSPISFTNAPSPSLCSAMAPRTSRSHLSTRQSPSRATADCRRSLGWWGTTSGHEAGGPGDGSVARTTLAGARARGWRGLYFGGERETEEREEGEMRVCDEDRGKQSL